MDDLRHHLFGINCRAETTTTPWAWMLQSRYSRRQQTFTSSFPSGNDRGLSSGLPPTPKVSPQWHFDCFVWSFWVDEHSGEGVYYAVQRRGRLVRSWYAPGVICFFWSGKET